MHIKCAPKASVCSLPSSGSAVCYSACNGGFRRTTHLKLPANQSSLCWLLSERWGRLPANEKSSRRNHLCFTACLCHGAVWRGYEVFTATNATFFVKLQAPQVISTTATHAEQKSFPRFQCYCQLRLNCHRDPISRNPKVAFALPVSSTDQ